MDTRQLTHQIRTETEGMLCDESSEGCRAFAAYAYLPDAEHDPTDVYLYCATHHAHVADWDGLHIDLAPIDDDLEQLKERLGV